MQTLYYFYLVILNLKKIIIAESRKMMAERVAMITNKLILSNFFTKTAPMDTIKAPNPVTAKLRNGLKQFTNFSVENMSFLGSDIIANPGTFELDFL